MAVIKGIDVSEHNGKLDWGKIGCDFAILRGGFGSGDIDSEFMRNAESCPVPFGVYWFSYAYTVERAVAEAKKLLTVIKSLKKRPELPLFFDWEYDSDRYAKQNGVTVDKTLYTQMACAFMDEIKKAGYKAGNYYNKDYYRNYCGKEVLDRSQYVQWLAYYSDKADLECDIWQYSENGILEGFTGDVNEMKNTALLSGKKPEKPAAPAGNSRVLGTGKNQITNPYGDGHGGVDVVKQANELDDITAHSAGTVVFCQTGIPNDTGASGNRSYGNCVKIEHSNGYFTLYAHLDSVGVKLGEKVKKGQVIGAMGNTGNSYGAHLHFELRNTQDERINPTPYLNANLPGENTSEPSEPDKAVKVRVWASPNSAGKLTDVAIQVSRGTVWYQVHILGGDWLPKVDGFDTEEPKNGFAGNGKVIDGIRVYYQTPKGEAYQQARYAVKTEKSGGKWLPEQVDDSVKEGMDGYAGNFGEAITAVKVRVAAK